MKMKQNITSFVLLKRVSTMHKIIISPQQESGSSRLSDINEAS
jgi:hypothetical protein